MEKDRSGKVIAIVALLVGVLGLTIGFAAFANNLTISSTAEYNPSSSIFNVDFSNSSSSVVAGSLTAPTLSPATNGPTGGTATVNNTGDPSITGISATFTEPGQSVTYTFYIHNAGEMKAFLNEIDFGDASPAAGESSGVTTVGSGFKTCTQLSKQTNPNPATVTTMTAACEDITLTLTLNNGSASDSFTADSDRGDFTAPTTHDLEVSAHETGTITIAYPAGSDRADGDFTVNFGDITFTYESTAAQ